MLQNIRIVLIETSNSENIGSTARAMKTMGLSKLWLVNPLIKPDSRTNILATGATDIINNAKIVDTLDKAISECNLVIGTSARLRTLPWPILDPRECGLKSVSEAQHTPVAILFGRERIGLTNYELQKCHYHVVIATNPEFSSLNLAMAVQIIAYEVRTAWLTIQDNHKKTKKRYPNRNIYPLVENLERFYKHTEQILLMIGFISVNRRGQVMNKLRRLFTRARLERQELNILQGILASIERINKVSRYKILNNNNNEKKEN